MGNSIFRFKQFSVVQEQSAMKVGTDGILLGAWANINNAKRILDIGAGTGVISLMLAQRNPNAIIDAIEIDPIAASECKRNFEASKWSNRLHIINQDILSYKPDFTYDAIVTNPPFFSNGIKAPDKRRAIARHNVDLPFDALLRRGIDLISSDATISIIAPSDVKNEIEFTAGECNLWIRSRTAIKAAAAKPIKRYLWEFTNFKAETIDTELILMENAERSAAYSSLTHEFYL